VPASLGVDNQIDMSVRVSDTRHGTGEDLHGRWIKIHHKGGGSADYQTDDIQKPGARHLYAEWHNQAVLK
jgi:hypothetical protein